MRHGELLFDSFQLGLKEVNQLLSLEIVRVWGLLPHVSAPSFRTWFGHSLSAFSHVVFLAFKAFNLGLQSGDDLLTLVGSLSQLLFNLLM